MAKRNQEPIRTEAFVTVDGQEVNIDSLPKEKRDAVGAALKAAYLNAMLRGQALFYVRKMPEGVADSNAAEKNSAAPVSDGEKQKPSQ